MTMVWEEEEEGWWPGALKRNVTAAANRDRGNIT
jgi:hypothetical protein